MVWPGTCSVRPWVEERVAVAMRHRAMERAGRYLQKGQNAKAIREFEKLLAQHPGDVRARHRSRSRISLTQRLSSSTR